MYCTNCGASLHDEAVVCMRCGVATSNYVAIKQTEKKKETNVMAIIGFICSFFVCVLGLVFGCIGLRKSKTIDDEGKGLSIAAIVISSIPIALIVFIFILAIIMSI